jgi:type I restriction enzyme S subunit
VSFPPYAEYKDSGVAWLGAVPGHWEVIKAKRALQPRAGGNLIKGQCVQEAADGLVQGFSASGPDVWLSDANFLTDGLVLSAVGARCGKVFLATGTWGTVANTQALLPSELGDCKFLWYLTNDEAWWEKGGAAQPYVLVGQSLDRHIGLPPLAEQEAIAGFLDREVGKIDGLVAEQERLIALLKEKRQAVISHAVTKGLNASAPLKDSGIEWLGQIPEHWEVAPLKYSASVGNGSTPNKDDMRFWTDGSFPWLNSSVVNMDVVDASDNFVTDVALAECHLPVVRPPAILMAITGQGKTRGMVAPLAIEATISQHVAFIKPDLARLGADFALWWLESQYQRIRADSEGAGSTKGAITCDQISRFIVALPPLGEQAAIARHLEKVAGDFRELEAEAQSAITLLQERRAALISAAVTGKIDVRAAAATAPSGPTAEMETA